mgnify:CR=1 FL=1
MKDEQRYVEIISGLRDAAKNAKQTRMDLNAENFNVYHLRQDYSDKIKGQSTEFLAKQATITEEFVSFLQQGLVDQKKWFAIEKLPGADASAITPDDAEKILFHQLKKNGIYNFIGDMLKLGALGSLMIVKVGGKKVQIPSYKTESSITEDGKRKVRLKRVTKEKWQLSLNLVRQEDYYPDPTGDGLYEIEEMEVDYHQLLKIAENEPESYDIEAIKQLGASPMLDQRAKKARETNQNDNTTLNRKRVKITEFWGSLVDDQSGELLFENCVCTVANDHIVIRKPEPNPLWHGESPYVVNPIIRVPKSVWHKALSDAPTRHNIALNELYNLMLDGGMMEAHGIKQIHEGWLEDPDQISDGITPGTTLRVNNSCPPQAKVLEQVATGTVGPNALQMFNITYTELSSAYMSNQFRQGAVPDRAVKATEIVASNNALTGVFSGMVKVVESGQISDLLRKSWLMCAEFLDNFDQAEMIDLLGEQKAAAIMAMSPEERFAQTATGFKFNVFGLSMVMNKINDFRKITTLLQTISSDPNLLQAFMQQMSMGKLLTEIIKTLDIDIDKIKNDGTEPQMINPQDQGGGSQGAPSQIPQAGAQRGGDLMSQLKSVMNEGLTNPGGGAGGMGGSQ